MSESITILCRSEALIQFYKKAPRPIQHQVVLMHSEIEQQFKASNAEVQLVDRPGIALGMHELVDQGIAETLSRGNGKDVKCQRGCSACCRLHVVVTEPEAKLARMAADEAGWPIDLERARQQAQAETVEQWRELPDDVRACVMLTPAGECAIYAYRPVACRKYQVVSDPADCDSVRKPGHQVQQLISMPAEVAFSAALGVFEAGTLAAMLLAEIPATSCE